MDFEFLSEMFIPVVMAACLCLGYVIKKWVPADNKIIPTVLLCVGAVLGCIEAGGITLGAIVAGGATGLAATGMHQVFKQFIEKGE